MRNLKLSAIFLIIFLVLTGCKRNISDKEISKIVSERSIDNITWEDFDDYNYQEDKTNGLTRIYTLDNNSTLILNGEINSKKPKIISIVEQNGNITYLKNESVQN